MPDKKKTNKAKKKRSLKRISLKAAWFGLIAFVVLIAGVAIFLTMIAINGEQNLSRNDLIAATLLDTVVLIGLLALFVFIARKKKHSLLRWTRKSALVLAPLVLVACVITTIALFGLDDNAVGVDPSAQQSQSELQVVGSQQYFEGLSFDAQELLAGTNKGRTDKGLGALKLNVKLNTSALKKCEDMVAKNYWAHNDPSGNEPWHFIADTGYSYQFAGENQAYGYTAESAVVAGWMASEGHRKNILDKNFTEVGFGTCKSENFNNSGKQLIVVQHFATPGTRNSGSTSSSPAPKPYVASKCTKTVIPYKTVYEEVSYMYVGETSSYGGYDGYIESCTADSTGYKPPDYKSSPIDKTVLVGTKPKPGTE